MTTLLSIAFSGVIAALITYGLNRWAAKADAKARADADLHRDAQQQTTLENWENRKYQANQKLYSLRALTEMFYAARSEIYFLGLDLTNADAMLLGIEQATEDFL